ncbi:ThuA domain-containing protein [Streptomyces cyanogenus]|uniref:Trehalose utilization protein n=1 Tax=Streptomyces cyanogenus TaxID=80860 RepID=A0ABX7TYA2_STRCY|nr:ThuA domain-containing protein [Streptomyces cyanogenus]QTE01741.1 Trehalose utilization protein [Streptomyces cyanogenus]
MPPRLLLHTRTADYRHGSIPDAVAAVRALGRFAVEHTEDPADLEGPLDGFAAVVFLSTSGEVLTPAGRERLEGRVRSGGGFAGVHAAACTEYGWPYHGELLGARFTRHPALQPGRALATDPGHPATRRLPAVWDFTDEWYDFDHPPAGRARILLCADETSYDGGGMGADHPLAWCREQGPAGGRVFYTTLGHAAGAYRAPVFLAHLNGGLTWAARLAE